MRDLEFAKDAKWLWAAYAKGKGAFGDDVFPPDMEYEAFETLALRVVAKIDFPMMMEAPVDGRGIIPIGMACLKRVESHVEPNFYWFWWASKRNKVEATLKTFFKLAEDVPFVIPVLRGSKEHRMMTQMEKYGVARRIGTSHNWYPEGPVALFETRD